MQQQQQQQTRQIFKEAYRGCSALISVREKAIRARLMVAPFKAKLGSGGGSKGGVARCLPTFLPIPMLYRVQSGSLAVLSRAKFMRSNPRRVQTKCANKPSQSLAKMQAKIYIETVHRRRSALNCICIGCSSYSSNCATPSAASASACNGSYR